MMLCSVKDLGNTQFAMLPSQTEDLRPKQAVEE